MHIMQLERELKLICDIDELSHDENVDKYKPAILKLAEEEATHSEETPRWSCFGIGST